MRALIAAVVLVVAVSPARAEGDSHEALVIALTERNAAREREFDERAAERNTRNAELRQAEAERRSHDALVAAEYATLEARARKTARRKTGLVVSGMGLGVGGIGALVFMSARADRASIESGGFATSADIQTRADRVVLKERLSFGVWATGALLTSVGVGVAW